MATSGAPNDCGVRCFNERKTYCKDLQKWGRNLLYMIGQGRSSGDAAGACLDNVRRPRIGRRKRRGCHQQIVISPNSANGAHQRGPGRYADGGRATRDTADCRHLGKSGLEQVAKHMTDRRQWAHISPFLDERAEHKRPAADWNPCDICPVCAGRRFSSMDAAEMSGLDTDATLLISTKSAKQELLSVKAEVCGDDDRPKLNFDHIFSNVVADAAQSNAFSQMFAPPMFPPMAPFFGIGSSYLQQLFQWSAGLGGGPSFNWNPYLNPVMQMTGGGSLDLGFPSIPQQAIPSPAAAATAVAVPTSGKSDKTLTPTIKPLKTPQPQSTPAVAVPPTSTSKRETSSPAVAVVAASTGDEQPLDLSRKPAKANDISSASSSSLSSKQLKAERAKCDSVVASSKALDLAPMCRTKSPVALPTAAANGVVPLPTVKRTYSQADLDAAVKDIRCGRLGTRRASVVYGIPRSTLRNKIYKLEAAEEQNGETPTYKKGRRGASNVCISTSPLVTTVQNDSPPSDRSDEGSSNQFTLSWDHLGQAAAAAAANSDWTHALWSSFMRQQQPATFPADAATAMSSKERSSADEKHADSRSPADSVGSGSGQQDWKRSRPKRGQYRRYDKDALDEAVKSVRRGEMSVHRAGSYYGVPHSTLEYKVKERNLLRAKKRAHLAGESVVKTSTSDGEVDGEASSAEGSLSAAEKGSDALLGAAAAAADSILNLSSCSSHNGQQQSVAESLSAP
uniref:HTH psq-type domain-containing protein n=1 Tax=Plectus sambesii TaxID=2011161 RepID=A0A914WYX3_9BILA